MAINFSDRVMVTNPTLYHLGRAVACVGILNIVVGAISDLAGFVLLFPPGLWCAIGLPAAAAGAMIASVGLTRN